MNSYTIDEKSISYKFVKRLSFKFFDGEEDYPKDFCTYWRHVLLWSPLFLAMLLLISLYFLFAVYLLFYLLIGETLQFLIALSVIFFVVMAIIGCIETFKKTKYIIIPFVSWVWNRGPKQVLSFIFRPLGFVLNWLFLKTGDAVFSTVDLVHNIKKRKVTESSDKDYVEKQPSMLKQRYMSLKEKCCPLVEYKV